MRQPDDELVGKCRFGGRLDFGIGSARPAEGDVVAGAGGEDAALKRERVGRELEDAEVGEDILIRVEELVVEDARRITGGSGLPGDPFAVGTQEGLRGPVPKRNCLACAWRFVVLVGSKFVQALFA